MADKIQHVSVLDFPAFRFPVKVHAASEDYARMKTSNVRVSLLAEMRDLVGRIIPTPSILRVC